MICPQCGGNMIHEPKKHYYRCENCKGEYWPEEERPKETTELDAIKLWKAEQRYKKSISKRGGGSRSKRHKKPQKKKVEPFFGAE